MSSQDTLQQAIALYQAGNPAEARPLLAQLVRQEPDNENAWMWLAACTDLPHEKRHCLEQVLRINPDNTQARQALDSFGPQQPASVLISSPDSIQAARPIPAAQKSFWQSLSPDLRASLIFGLFHVISSVINTSTGGLAFIFSFPGLILLALFQGFYVVRFAKQDKRYVQKDYLGLAARSGLWTWLLSLLLILAIVAIMMGISLGTYLAVLPILLMERVGMLIVLVAGSVVGAWLYNKFGGTQLALYSCLSIFGCSLLLGLLLIGLIALLASFGYQALQGL